MLQSLQNCLDCISMSAPASTSLRERKKLETHRAISHAARSLVRDRGLDRVTVDDIAEAANVSPRTFFNYFSCKEEALVGIDPGVLRELADELRSRPGDESPVAALRAVLVGDSEPQAMVQRWELVNELVREYPALTPRHLATLAEFEAALTEALAERLGVGGDDPQPVLLVTSMMASLRAAARWWLESDRSTSLDDVIDQACALFDRSAR